MRKIFLLLLILLLISFGCGKRAYKTINDINKLKFISPNWIPEGPPMEEGAKDRAKNTNDKLEDILAGENIPVERKRIKTGHITLEVKELQDTEKSIEVILEKYNGYVSSSNYYQTSLNLEIRIPADNFDDFLVSAETVGKLKQKTINVEDVTQHYFDLENKIKNKRILQERYQSYLQRAANTKELLETERALNDVTTEIEQLEGSFRLLNSQISYSTLTIGLSLPVYENIRRSLPSLKKGFQDFGYNFLEFLYVVLFIILYGLLFGTPIVIIVGAFYFFGFGKVGIIRKFFKVLSSKK